MKKREARINETLRSEVGRLIFEEISFSRNVLITVTRAQVTQDLLEAKIYISVLPEKFSKEVINILTRKTFRLQQMLNKIVNIKRTPKIIFREEKRIKEASRIDELLELIRKNGNN